jgi:hypothetical protein
VAIGSRTWAAAAVPLAMTASNVLAYALVLLAAHRLDAGSFGEVSSLLGLLLISTIPMTALQTVVARRAALGGASRGVWRGVAVVAVGAGALLCVLGPALADFLHLDDVVGILLVAATVPANATLGAAIGLAQGRRQFFLLAWRTFTAIGFRSIGGMVGLVVGGSPDSTIAGVLVGVTTAAVLSVLPTGRPSAEPPPDPDSDAGGLVAETLHAAHAYGLFVIVTSLGVLLAQHLLSPTGAGMFAVGAALTRAVVWMPQFVPMLLFASMAQKDLHVQALRRAGLSILGLGLVAIAGSALFGRYVVSALGGARYHALDGDMWLFATLGVLLCQLQLAITAGLAQRRRRHAAVMWALIGADLLAALVLGDHATPVRLVVALVCVTAVAAGVALVLLLRASPGRLDARTVPPPGAGQNGGQDQQRNHGESEQILGIQQVRRAEDEHQRGGREEHPVEYGAQPQRDHQPGDQRGD